MSLSQKKVIREISEAVDSFTRNELFQNLRNDKTKKNLKKNKKVSIASKEADTVDKTLSALKAAGLISKKKNRYRKEYNFEQKARLKISRNGKAVAESADFSISVKRENTGNARNDDDVLVKITGIRGSSLTGEVVSVFSRKRENFMARVTGKTGEIINYRILDAGEKIDAVSKRFSGEPETGSFAKVTLSPSKSGLPMCSVQTTYDPDDESIDVQRVILKHNLPAPYKGHWDRNELMKTADEEGKAPRKDYRKLFTVTIDDETAKDFDDALSITKDSNGYTLYVHIADVSSYVKKGSELDIEGASRGNSYYIGDTVIPMLPEVISNDLCSLKADTDRLSMSVEMRVNSQGEIISSSFHKGIINVDKRLTYISAASLIKGLPVTKTARALKEMMKVASRIHENRVRSGRIDLNLGDAKIVYDENRRAKSIVYGERLPSHLLVEESMLSANEEVSRFIRETGVPSLYRVHEPMSPESLTALAKFFRTMGVKLSDKNTKPEAIQRAVASVSGMDSERVINMAVLKSMMQAFYGTSPDGHFGLAFADYTHFTSPIRRYPDLIIHRVLKSIIDKKKPPYPQQELLKIGEHSSETERQAQRAERDLFRIKSCRLMSGREGEIFEAVISGVSKYGIYVTLTVMPVEGMVPMRMLTDDYYLLKEDDFTVIGKKFGRRFRLGDHLQVRLSNADIDMMRIDFEPVSGRK